MQQLQLSQRACHPLAVTTHVPARALCAPGARQHSSRRSSNSSRCSATPPSDNSGSSWRSNLFGRSNGTTATTTTSPTPSPSSSSPLGSVLGSLDEAELQRQQAQQFQAAFQQGTLGFGFSAGGLLFPYYLGVAQQLQQLGILQDATQLAGASAGSLIVACIKSGLSFDTIKAACWELAKDCRDNGTRHRLRHVLEGTLREVLPNDVADACSGRIHIAVTRLTPGLQPTFVSYFKDREDLIQGLLTSCHIPWYFDGSLVRSYRKAPCFDGGITNFLPNVPGGITPCRVCCLPRQQLAAIRNIAISPDAFQPWPYGVSQMLNWALEPAEEDMLEELIRIGRRDALHWAQLNGLDVLASSSSSSSSSMSSSSEGGSIYSPMGSMVGAVLLPTGGSSSSSSSGGSAAAMGGSIGGGGFSGGSAAASQAPVAAAAAAAAAEEAPVGTSLLGLVKALVSHSTNSSKR